MLEIELAQKINSVGKRFFLIRTKIDEDVKNEKAETSEIDAMLKNIRADLRLNVKDLDIPEGDIFVVSNLDTDKWDFKRLIQATTTLPVYLKIALLTALSKDIVREKVDDLRGM
jgi:hypothetical protein